MFRLEFQDVRRMLTRSQKWTGSRQELRWFKNPNARTFLFRIRQSGVLSILRAGRAQTFGLSNVLGYAMMPA